MREVLFSKLSRQAQTAVTAATVVVIWRQYYSAERVTSLLDKCIEHIMEDEGKWTEIISYADSKGWIFINGEDTFKNKLKKKGMKQIFSNECIYFGVLWKMLQKLK